MKHPIKPPSSTKKPTALRRDAPVAPQWPSYTGTSQFTGTSPSGRVTVYVDPTLDPPGLQNAQEGAAGEQFGERRRPLRHAVAERRGQIVVDLVLGGAVGRPEGEVLRVERVGPQDRL